jgi:glutamate-ammonia-ligase adenylyltransferase
MIKARPCAGDIELGEYFIKQLRPYIWRKYLDFAAIADVQSLKRQIHAVKGHGEIAVAGHNIKLGRGGIREIEFFVQTQQLIAGGRNGALRGTETCAMLDALAKAGWIKPEVAEDMKSAYGFLRTLEHRLQMLEDQQTHTMPEDAPELEKLACFAGFANADAMGSKLRSVLEMVQKHYNLKMPRSWLRKAAIWFLPAVRMIQKP